MTRSDSFSSSAQRIGTRLAIVGAVLLAIGAWTAPDRVWSNLLLSSYYLVTLALGGALFVALTYASNASWHVAFRRIPEAMATTLLPLCIGLLGTLALCRDDYAWHAHGDAGSFWFKQWWTNPTLWIARAVVYVVLWIVLSRALVTISRRQDRTANVHLTQLNRRFSALFLFVYAITFSLASGDWLMLLEPMWFSTIWGVYHFSGMVEATLAAMIVLAILLRRHGPLRGVFTNEHLHDLGKLLLGFSCFWMYIWFSQYMLIWYTNIPEETSYFLSRTQGAWGPVMIVSLLLNWIVPFFVLLPRPCKRSESVMIKIAVVVLIGRWVDLYWMIFPSTTGSVPSFALWEIASILSIMGIFAWLFMRAFAQAPPVPTSDPLLGESLHYHC